MIGMQIGAIKPFNSSDFIDTRLCSIKYRCLIYKIDLNAKWILDNFLLLETIFEMKYERNIMKQKEIKHTPENYILKIKPVFRDVKCSGGKRS